MTALSTIVSSDNSVEISNDVTPELGGDLKTGSYDIVDTNGNEVLSFDYVASAVNEITVKNAATGSGPEIQAIGSDTDIDIELVPKGAGTVLLLGNLDTNGKNILINNTLGILDEASNEQLKFSTTASAVNEVTIKNAATGSGPEIQATGGDTNIDIELVPKGTGTVNLLDGVLKRSIILDYAETPQAPSSTSTTVLNVENGNVISFTLTEATVVSTSNILADYAGSLTMVITAAGTEYAITWPATWKWAGSAAPATFAISTEHIINLMWTDGDNTAKFYATYVNSYGTA
jgi:hypothetical protein